LRAVGKSQHALACLLIANVDRRHHIEKAQTIQLVPAASQQYINTSGRIITNLQRGGPNKIELHIRMNSYRFVLARHTKPKRQGYRQGKKLQAPVFDKDLAQSSFDAAWGARAIGCGNFFYVLKRHDVFLLLTRGFLYLKIHFLIETLRASDGNMT